MTVDSRGTDNGGSAGRRRFAECWLRMAGVSRDEVERRAERARRRSSRYPLAVRAARFGILLALNWLGPLLWLGRWSRAVHLEPEAFDELMEACREHRWSAVRMAGLAAVAPLMEVVAEDEPPMVADHPLEGRSMSGETVRDGERYDVVVIGSGAGGAPAAARLAEEGARVAVVEKGELVEAQSTSAALEQHYVHQGLLGVARGTPLVVLAGEAVGGTTSVNSGTSLRPLQEALVEWDRRLGTDFAEGRLEPWLDRVSEAISIRVPPDELRSTSSRKVAEGLEAIGRPDHYGLPRCIDGCRGSGRCCFGCPTGAKQSTDRAFLPSALNHGADLLAGFEARGIRERGGFVEVDVYGDGGRRRLEAGHLIVSAGAIFTPQLLRANRLGSHWWHAGDHFKTHPATKIFAHFPEIRRPDTFPGIPQGLGYKPPELERVTMEGAELPTSAVGPMIAAGGGRFRRWLNRHGSMVSYGAMVRDRNAGSLHSLFGEPVISYEMHPEDAADLVRALKIIGRAFFAAGAERVLCPWPGRENEFSDVDALGAVAPEDISAEQLLLSGFHPQGTAGIGRVVDTDLRLRGSNRISVCDASVLPDSPGVNPQVTIMALSLRLADDLASR